VSLSTVVFLFCEVLTVLIIIRALGSTISPERANARKGLIYQITEPVLAPLRRILPRLGRIDISPFVAIIILQLIMLVVSII
jgi:YggT family protein